MKDHIVCLNCGQTITNPTATICYSCGHNVAPANVPPADAAPKFELIPFNKWAPLIPARGTKQSPDFVADDNHRRQALPATRNRSFVPAARKMLEILLATTLALATLTAIIRPKSETKTQPGAEQTEIACPTKQKWDLTAREITDIGAVVRPYSEDHPNLMAVQLRPGVVLSRSSAHELAKCAHSMLGPFALVTIRDASGKMIGLASH